MSDTKSSADRIQRYSSLKVFADGHIDEYELAMIERIAMRDGEVDDAEREALAQLFARVTQDSVPPGLWQEIERFKEKYEIP